MSHVPTMTPARQAREAAGLSIEVAARKAFIGVSYLKRVEREGVASYILACRLARLYSCSIRCFMKTREGGMPPAQKEGRKTLHTDSARTSISGSRTPQTLDDTAVAGL